MTNIKQKLLKSHTCIVRTNGTFTARQSVTTLYLSVTVVVASVAVVADDTFVGEREAEMIALVEMEPLAFVKLNLKSNTIAL